MSETNYLIDFLTKLDTLISEINKLDAKIRAYKRNSSKFGFDFDVKFSISPEYFEKLRLFLHVKIEEGSAYNAEIVNLKREFFRQYLYLMMKMKQEMTRIDNVQEEKMNKIVYKAIYSAKYEHEIKNMNSFDVESSLVDSFLGIAKYRKLMVKNHELKSKLILKEYDEIYYTRRNIFELVSMIENTDIKNGELLCLQDDMIKNFLIDRHTVKRNIDYSWKQAQFLPNGFFSKKAHFKILNNAVMEENKALEAKLEEDRLTPFLSEKNINKNRLVKLNESLSKILKNGLILEQ